MEGEEYEIGYAKPPKHTRFSPASRAIPMADLRSSTISPPT